MNPLRSRPFLCLAGVTVLLGALWHAMLADTASDHAVLTGVIRVVGAPFIGAMRASNALLGASKLTPLVGLMMGLVPYLFADWIFRRVRSRRAVEALRRKG
jgi:hypothetical protein